MTVERRPTGGRHWACRLRFARSIARHTASVPTGPARLSASCSAPCPVRVRRGPQGESVHAARNHGGVPRISEFYGIIVAMYFREHGMPHFHATYAGETVVVAIETGEVLAGAVPLRAQRMVSEWLELHRAELGANWDRARNDEPLEQIAPLP